MSDQNEQFDQTRQIQLDELGALREEAQQQKAKTLKAHAIDAKTPHAFDKDTVRSMENPLSGLVEFDEDSTRSISRDSLTSLIKNEVNESNPETAQTFGILKRKNKTPNRPQLPTPKQEQTEEDPFAQQTLSDATPGLEFDASFSPTTELSREQIKDLVESNPELENLLKQTSNQPQTPAQQPSTQPSPVQPQSSTPQPAAEPQPPLDQVQHPPLRTRTAEGKTGEFQVKPNEDGSYELAEESVSDGVPQTQEAPATSKAEKLGMILFILIFLVVAVLAAVFLVLGTP